MSAPSNTPNFLDNPDWERQAEEANNPRTARQKPDEFRNGAILRRRSAPGLGNFKSYIVPRPEKRSKRSKNGRGS